MIKVYRDPETKKLYVRAKVAGAGEMQHTFPCRTPWKCPICQELPNQPNHRRYAQEVGERFLSELRQKRKEQSKQQCSLTTVGEALTRYKLKRLGNNADLGKQESTFKRLWNEFRNTPIEAVWASTSAFVTERQQTGDLKPSSINRCVAMLKAAIRQCYETRTDFGARLIPDHYLSAFPMLEERNIEYLILNKSQMETFWQNLDTRLKPFFYFSCRTPIREGEAFNIRREHINPFSGLIQLPFDFCKNSEQRQIKILPEMEEYVHRFLASPAEYLFNRGEAEDYRSMGYYDQKTKKIVFTLRKTWQKAVVAAGVPKYNLHKTRQQAVMTLWAEGWTEDEIMLYGGWKSREAFYHYFNREMALWIRQGQHNLDLTWKQTFAEDLRRAA